MVRGAAAPTSCVEACLLFATLAFRGSVALRDDLCVQNIYIFSCELGKYAASRTMREETVRSVPFSPRSSHNIMYST